MKKDPIYKQIIKTKDAFVNNNNFDPAKKLALEMKCMT